MAAALRAALEAAVAGGAELDAAALARALDGAGVEGDTGAVARLLLREYDADAGGTLDAEECRNLVSRIAHEQRGAPFARQVALAARRSLAQQRRGWRSAASEAAVGAVLGAMVALQAAEARGGYAGVLRAPFAALSASPREHFVPQMALLVGLALGSAAVPQGVAVFGGERPAYWREFAAGHGRLAYFLGKNLALVPRHVFCALHFAGAYCAVAAPVQGAGFLFALALLDAWACYGLAMAVSMCVAPVSAPIVGIVAMILACIGGGYVERVPLAARYASYHFWASEAYYDAALAPAARVYDVALSTARWRYTLGRAGADLGLVFVLGLAYRAAAFALMVKLNVRKQR